MTMTMTHSMARVERCKKTTDTIVSAVHALTSISPPKRTSTKSQYRKVEERDHRNSQKKAQDDRRIPPAYTELSPHFGVLERAAENSGN